jgi:CheY-like chemotaxis protein
MLAEVIALGEAMAREKGLCWQTDIPEDLPYVWGDQTRLQQVTLNLVSNAVKFTSSGTITLWVDVGKNQLMVAVSDTGIGILVEEQNIIFEEFFQSERTMDQGFGGKGLGLAISRRLIELHGGRIGVLSTGTRGSGATVYYTLPIMACVKNETTPFRDRSTTVLILTEKTGDKHLLYDHLTSRGFKVELTVIDTKGKWSEGFFSAPPGAVVLDYEADGARGWEVMRELTEYLPSQDIPVVFYTLSEDRDAGALLNLDYLIKPVSSSDLARALARQGFSQEANGKSRTILIVDDDPGILDLHTRILAKLIPRCQVISAQNGREALDIMARRRPDLVVLDLVMPVLDGFAVLQAMREREQTRHVPVIVLTGQNLTEQDMARLRRGVAAVLGKGLYSRSELLEQVESVLNRNKQLYNDTQWAMRQTMAYIHENYTKSISRVALAARVGLSDRYLTQCFRLETGLTPIKYLNRYRIRQARMLLEQGEMNVTEVALAVGFTDPSYFARVFRDEIGISPRAYQGGERTPSS